MAKGIRLGAGGVKISKKCWVGVEDATRKVKKVFVGVGGAVKVAYSAGVTWIGAVTGLSQAKCSMASSYNSNYGLFAGGRWYNTLDGSVSSYSNTVDAYNKSMVRTSATLYNALDELGSTQVGDYAIFTGGINKNGSTYKTGAVFNQVLTRTSIDLGSSDARRGVGIGNDTHALLKLTSNTDTVTLLAWNESLVKVNSLAMTHSATSVEVGRTGVYALFIASRSRGGAYDPQMNAFNGSLVRTTAPAMPYIVDSSLNKTTSSTTHAMFRRRGNVSAYNSSLVVTSFTLPVASIEYSVGVGDNVVFGKVAANEANLPAKQYVYDNSLVLAETIEVASMVLSNSSYLYSTVSIGDYGLLSGLAYLSSTLHENRNNVYAFKS